MRLTYQDEPVEVFTMNHRVKGLRQGLIEQAAAAWEDIRMVVSHTDRFGGSGVLFFEGNDVPISPWLAGAHTFSSTERLSPLVALNPVFMHPFQVAKFCAGFAIMHGRRTYLNLITGTAMSYLEALNAGLPHDARYQRLREYSLVIRQLMESRGEPVTYHGQFYHLDNAKLEVDVPDHLHPEFFISGQSDIAKQVAQDIGASHMVMMGPNLLDDMPEGTRGVHYGIMSRPTEEEAWSAIVTAFAPDQRMQRMQAMSMANTDGEWKKKLYEASKATNAKPGYWLDPFSNYKADQPYFVGSREQNAELLAGFVRRGVRRFIIDFPGWEEAYTHTAAAFALAQEILNEG